MNRLVVYAVPFVGALLFAAGVGGAVVGGYGAVQEELDLCGTPTISVTTPESAGWQTNGTGGGATLPRLTFDDLSPAEREAFEEALRRADNEGEVSGEFPHQSEFRNGAVVVYEGREYFASLESMNECVSITPLAFPLGVGGVALGLALFVLPGFADRRAARRRGAEPPTGLLESVRSGRLADIGAFVAFTTGVSLAVAPLALSVATSLPLAPMRLVGFAAAGAVVGLAANSARRAFVLGGYLGVLTAGALIVAVAWFDLPVGTGFGGLPTTFTLVTAVGIPTVAATVTRWLV